MLEAIPPVAPDKIIQLIQKFREDPRDQKVDLGVGVYKNAHGITPVMAAVKEAESRLWNSQTTKTYTALAGDTAFHEAMIKLILGNTVARDRIAAAHTPGGTGAVRMAFEVIKMASPDTSVWVSNPSWPNHKAILEFIGMNMREYSYFDRTSKATDFSGMMSDLQDAKQGDAIVLHGCCHNPTGSDLAYSQWEELAEFLLERNIIPIIDFAYQGFGDGLEEDARALRMVASKFPETLIAGSCSKNFGLYRERAGILLAVTQENKTRTDIQGVLASLNRISISFPPDHGGSLVAIILNDDELAKMWREELEATRINLLDLRVGLARELRDLTGSDRFGFLASHKGMFSLTGCTPEQVITMREKHGIYLVGDSRINVAGLNEKTVAYMAKAMVDAGM